MLGRYGRPVRFRPTGEGSRTETSRIENRTVRRRGADRWVPEEETIGARILGGARPAAGSFEAGEPPIGAAARGHTMNENER